MGAMRDIDQELQEQEQYTPKTKAYILHQYEQKLQRWQEQMQPVADLRELTFNDVMLLVLKLHPTNRADSKELTRKVINYLAEQKIATSYEIMEGVGISYPALLDRLKILRVMNLVRRESREFYIASPRLYEFVKTYMHHLN